MIVEGPAPLLAYSKAGIARLDGDYGGRNGSVGTIAVPIVGPPLWTWQLPRARKQSCHG